MTDKNNQNVWRKTAITQHAFSANTCPVARNQRKIGLSASSVTDALTRHMNGLVIKLLMRRSMFVIFVNWMSKEAKQIAFKFHTANDYVQFLYSIIYVFAFYFSGTLFSQLVGQSTVLCVIYKHLRYWCTIQSKLRSSINNLKTNTHVQSGQNKRVLHSILFQIGEIFHQVPCLTLASPTSLFFKRFYEYTGASRSSGMLCTLIYSPYTKVHKSPKSSILFRCHVCNPNTKMFIENVWSCLLSTCMPNSIFLATVDSQSNHFKRLLCYCTTLHNNNNNKARTQPL